MNKRERKAAAAEWVKILLVNTERYMSGLYSLEHFESEQRRAWSLIEKQAHSPRVTRQVRANLSFIAR